MLVLDTLGYVEALPSTVGQQAIRVFTHTRPKGKKERVSLIIATGLGSALVEQAPVVTDTVNKNAFLAFLELTLLLTLALGQRHPT